MTMQADIAIIGGGISGLSLAYELARLRFGRIVVVDSRYTGSGASGRNIGRVRSRHLAPDLIPLAMAAYAKHAGLGDELGVNTLLWRVPCPWVFYDDAEYKKMATLVPVLARFNLAVTLLETKETLRRLPILLGGELPLGAMIGNDAVVHHDAVNHAYRQACIAGGVELLEHRKVEAIDAQGGSVAGIATTGGFIRAPLVVNAAGGWSAEVSRLAGVTIPNRPVRREVLISEPYKPFTNAAITFYRPVEGWFHQSLRGEIVAGVVDKNEPPGSNHASSLGFLERTASLLIAKAPRLANLRIIRQFGGTYDMTPDRRPLVGFANELAGFVQMNGYSGRGFTFAPVLAEHLARLIACDQPSDLLRPLDPNRFAARDAGGLDFGTDYYAGFEAAQAVR